VEIVPTWQKLAWHNGVGLSVGWSQFAEGWLHYQRNELEEAKASFCRFTEVAWGAHGRTVIDGYTGLVLTELARGRSDEASAHIGALHERLLERGMVALASMAQSLAQRVALAGGSPSSLDWRPDPSSMTVPSDLWEQPVLTQVRTFVAAGSPGELVRAAELLADSRAKALARNSNRRLIEIGALQALVLAGQGQHVAALAALQEAVERAAPGRTLRLLADCGPGLTPLLQKLQTAGVAAAYIGKVLAACEKRAAVDRPTAAPVVPVHPPAVAPLASLHVPAELLTNREIDVLVLLAERLSDKEIAERLVLSPVTVKKHTQRIYGKLGVHSRRAAVNEARRLGLI
jgi:LuxR family maltose regulon positive regulatory protein